jgi:hypothetical protein
MDACYQKNVCNCVKDCKCENGYECCSQNYNGKPPKYGLCVKKGTCDKERGICNSIKSSVEIIENVETYKNFIKENYENDNDDNDNCKEWKKGFWFLFIFFIIVLFVYLSRFVCK